MAEPTTKPQTSMETELWYATDKTGTDIKQILQVQEIPTVQTAQEPVTYGNLESTTEFSAKGRRKSESIAIPILYVEEQHDALKALETSDAEVWFFVKLPERTAKTSEKPLVYAFCGSVSLSNDTISIDGMLQETLTIFKSSETEEMKGLPSAAA